VFYFRKTSHHVTSRHDTSTSTSTSTIIRNWTVRKWNFGVLFKWRVISRLRRICAISSVFRVSGTAT